MRYACRMRKLFWGAVSIVLLAGCGAPYQFIAHAEPSPFTRPGCRVTLEPVHVDQLMVGGKPVAQYVAEKKAESADSFDGDLRQSDELFHQRIIDEHGSLFMPGAPDNTFVIRPVFTHWEPGFYAVITSQPGVAEMVVDVLSPAGQVLDRISIKTAANDMSSGGRMRAALRSAGHAVSRYIEDNWMCAAH